MQYEREKKKVGEHKGNQYINLEIGQNVPIPSTAEKLAEQHNVKVSMMLTVRGI